MSSFKKATTYIRAVFSALIGVQSQKNREADFKHKSAVGFIISGLILVGLFIAGLILVVHLVLS